MTTGTPTCGVWRKAEPPLGIELQPDRDKRDHQIGQ
jgi:hypothetical protein